MEANVDVYGRCMLLRTMVEIDMAGERCIYRGMGREVVGIIALARVLTSSLVTNPVYRSTADSSPAPADTTTSSFTS